MPKAATKKVATSKAKTLVNKAKIAKTVKKPAAFTPKAKAAPVKKN